MGEGAKKRSAPLIAFDGWVCWPLAVPQLVTELVEGVEGFGGDGVNFWLSAYRLV